MLSFIGLCCTLFGNRKPGEEHRYGIHSKTQNASGKISYRVEIRLKGFPPQRATFKRLTDAKKWASATESAIRERRYFKTAEALKHSFADMIDRYTKDVLTTKPPKSEKLQGAQLSWWRKELGHHTLADVSSSMISECRDKLRRGKVKSGKSRSAATVNRYLAALSHCFTIAIKDWEWLEDSPMSKVTKMKEPRGRIRFLSDDERDRLLAACKESSNPYLYPVVVLALSTGMRHGEIMGLKWSDIDFKEGRITLYETKNDEIRVVPLTGLAKSLIEAHAKVRPIDTPLLFPSDRNRNTPQDIRSPWLAALKSASIENFLFHDLRHSAASYLAMNGASLAEIAEVLGHKTLQMVKRYAHLSEGHTAKVVADMNAKIFG